MAQITYINRSGKSYNMPFPEMKRYSSWPWGGIDDVKVELYLNTHGQLPIRGCIGIMENKRFRDTKT